MALRSIFHLILTKQHKEKKRKTPINQKPLLSLSLRIPPLHQNPMHTSGCYPWWKTWPVRGFKTGLLKVHPDQNRKSIRTQPISSTGRLWNNKLLMMLNIQWSLTAISPDECCFNGTYFTVVDIVVMAESVVCCWCWVHTSALHWRILYQLLNRRYRTWLLFSDTQ